MPNYTCTICSRSFRRKDYLMKHYKRKNPCKPVGNVESSMSGKSKVNILEVEGKSKVSPSIDLGKSKVSPSIDLGKSKVSPSENLEVDIENSNSIEENSKKVYNCSYCNKEYYHKQSKYKHLKNCKIYQNIKEKAKKFDNIVEKLEKNNKSLILVNDNNEEKIKIRNNEKIKETDIVLSNKEKSLNENNRCCDTTTVRGGMGDEPNNNITQNNNRNTLNNSNNTNNTLNNTVNNHNSNNTNNNTNNNTVIINHINPFGKENLESITEEKIINILNQNFNSFQETIKAIHKDIPENSNFYLPNKSDRKHILYYDGINNIYESSTKFKDKLCDKIIKQIEEWYNRYNKRCFKKKRNMLKNVFNEYYDGKLEERYNIEVDKFLLTYSNEIKKIINNTLNN